MMTKEQKIIKAKVGLLELAKLLASGLRCRSPHHHRGDRCGSAEEGVTLHARRRRHGTDY
jgi:hypothetical protein